MDNDLNFTTEMLKAVFFSKKIYLYFSTETIL